MEMHILESSDGPPVKIYGQRIAYVPPPVNPPKYCRWYELAIYRTESQKFFLTLIFDSNTAHRDGGKTEQRDCQVIEALHPSEIEDFLISFSPMENVVGHPEGSKDWELKNTRLENQIDASFRRGVGQLLAAAAIVDDRFAVTS